MYEVHEYSTCNNRIIGIAGKEEENKEIRGKDRGEDMNEKRVYVYLFM